MRLEKSNFNNDPQPRKSFGKLLAGFTARAGWKWLLPLLAMALQARANLISNGSFESVTPALAKNEICTTDPARIPGLDPGAYPACAATGWTGVYQIGNVRTIGIFGVSFGIPQPDPDGSNALILQTERNLPPTATQSVDIPTAGLYALTFYAANRSSPAGNNGPQTISVLLDNSAIAGGSFGNLPGGWTLETLNFTATAGLHSLTLQGLDTNSAAVSAAVAAFVDDVSLVPAAANMPEPSTCALFGGGFLLLAGLFRRKR